MAVIVPLSLEELKTFFDDKAIEILEFQLEKNIIAQPEIKDNQDPLGLQITKEYLEQWCVQAIENVKPIGAGSYPIDIIKIKNWGADVKSLACPLNKKGEISNSLSNETSLAQKFTETGRNLDELFKEKKYDEIAFGWLDIVKQKNEKAIEDHKISDIYYFFFLRGFKEFYLCGAKLNLEDLSNVNVNEKKSSNSSVYLNNYIDDIYGETKIYKAKKRLELRLKPKTWINENRCLILNIPDYLPAINLRSTNLKEYKNDLFKTERE